MAGRHRRPSALRTTVRTGSLLAATTAAAAGLGVTATSQAATTAPTAPAAASHATASRHWHHVVHEARLARYRRPVHLTAYRGSSGGGSGSFQACVIAHESGGNPHAVNPYSGAGGLYQFLPGTFHALGYGGRPQDAPVWEQDQAFQRLYAQQGRQPWASNGC